ncbi:MAG TPA: dihydropteroate synthase [Solirubrobacteraceae bacterium]|nr:dihydropteroate synthase [Solirubrobacteraceae bacterium]
MTVRLALRDRVVECVPGRPLVMGVVNAGPDSFSDARRLGTLDAQLAHARALVAAGADLIDVGAESGVTYSDLTPAEVERERVVPLVAALAAEGVTVSVDTFKAPVARAAVDAGAAMINDVSGLADPELADICAASGAALVVMHTRAEPKREGFPDYADVAADVEEFLAQRAAMAVAAGVAADRIVLDPGPDFAKRPHETVAVLRAWERYRALGFPLLAAVSRKYFLGAITGRAPDARLASTLAAVLWAADVGAAIVRVHDVAEAVDALAVRRVLRGEAPVPDFDADDDALKWIRSDAR